MFHVVTLDCGHCNISPLCTSMLSRIFASTLRIDTAQRYVPGRWAKVGMGSTRPKNRTGVAGLTRVKVVDWLVEFVLAVWFASIIFGGVDITWVYY